MANNNPSTETTIPMSLLVVNRPIQPDTDLVFKISDEVAALKNTDPHQLPALNNAIDVDGLNRIYNQLDEDEHTPRIEFEYAGYTVVIVGTEKLLIFDGD